MGLSNKQNKTRLQTFSQSHHTPFLRRLQKANHDNLLIAFDATCIGPSAMCDEKAVYLENSENENRFKKGMKDYFIAWFNRERPGI